jgi:CheY-like chemotaxis protein
MQQPDVLVIDDHLDTCDLLVRALRRIGVEAQCATGGEEALDYLHDHRPALVLLDMNMPHVDGYHVLRSMRRDSELRGVPVVAFTGAGEKACEDALRLGADDFLIKGLASLPDVLRCVGKFIATN